MVCELYTNQRVSSFKVEVKLTFHLIFTEIFVHERIEIYQNWQLVNTVLLTKILTTWKFIQNWILLNFTIFLYDWKMERFWTLKVTVRKIQISDFFVFFDNIHKVQNISYSWIPYNDFKSDSAFENWNSMLYHAEIFGK